MTSLFLLVFLSASRMAISDSRPNVLFIVVEDLRVDPWFGTRNKQAMGRVTPNIERLASRGVSFDLAYAQVSVCAPSRASLLTGLRPDTLGIFDFSHYGGIRYFRTITSHLHRSGYQTSMSGKLQHWDSYRYYGGEYWGPPDWDTVHKNEQRWENASVTPDAVHNDPLDFFRDSFVLRHALLGMKKMQARRAASKSDAPWFQGVGFKGTHMPYHMPKRFHDKWADVEFDMPDAGLTFPPDAPLLAHVRKTEQVYITFMRDNATAKSGDKEFYQSMSGKQPGAGRTISRRGFTELYRGYLACLSYADHLVGLLLDAFDRENLWDNTIVVFTADHGMHVGEKGIWGKWTLFEESTHVPLIIVTPPKSVAGARPLQGVHVGEPVELIDVFPTLVALTGTSVEFSRPCAQIAPIDAAASNSSSSGQVVFNIPRGGPRQPVAGEGPIFNQEGHVFRHVYCDALDGTSLVSFLYPSARRWPWGTVDPAPVTPRLPFALTQKMTCKLPPSAPAPQRGRGQIPLYTDLDPQTPTWTDFCPNKREPRNPPFGSMGYALRTKSWKYVAWLRFDTHAYLPSLDRAPLAEQLYDLSAGAPERGSSLFRGADGELVNLAGKDEHASTQRHLRRQLFDFLFFNASFAHLYHRRLDDRARNQVLISGRLAGHPRDFSSRHFYF